MLINNIPILKIVAFFAVTPLTPQLAEYAQEATPDRPAYESTEITSSIES